MTSVAAPPTPSPSPLSPSVTRGHKKKLRTRQALLDAAFEVLAERGEGFSIVDVAARAGVSHGTFYNYFADRDALLDELVAHTVEEFAAVSAQVVDEPDPAVRFARISARALRAAVDAPDTTRFVLRLEAAQRALLIDGPLKYMLDDLTEGHRAGRFPEPPDGATVDVVLGALLMAARRVVDGESAPAYRTAVVRRVLMSLGVQADEAGRIAAHAVAGP